ncbi:MAG TPA: BREX-3 system P-loop-containing protein BrxF [Alphaproteobacteria bacterium]|nr:BREX-3 system P-loop-containing protein BrxF [Alphaproteobacteria bacterium]
MQMELWADRITRQIDQAAMLYHRLILVVAPSGMGKTRVLQEVAKRTGFRYINVNLELSRRLLDLTERQRALQASRLLSGIVAGDDEQAVLLDNTEVLFDVSLKQDPLRCLQGLSRQRTVVTAWNGTIEQGYLIYATPDHAEYRRYPAGDLLVVSPPAPAER